MRRSRVLVHGRAAGVLEEVEPKRRYRFAYDSGYVGEPVSLAMPPERTPYEFDRFPAVERVKLLVRVLFCFLVGNEDMHLKNFSVITRGSVRALSPAYDLLNTTIAMPNPVEELALPLRGKKRGITKNDLLGGFWDLIDASFLSEPKKTAYRDLLDQRIDRLGL